MIQTEPTLADLYEADETAWLDAMAELIGKGEHAELDYEHLREYLCDMANRDRKTVFSRLTVLITHVLKFTFQPNKRTKSWASTIIVQRQKLSRWADKGVLRNYAESILEEAYKDAVERAAHETQLPAEAFPKECPYTLDQLLTFDVNGGKEHEP